MQLSAATCVLFAAGFDWLEAVLPFLFVAFWILSQVFAVFRRLQGGGQKPPPLPRFDPARDRQRLPRPPAGDVADPRTDLEKQIAEFLREATGGQQRQPTVKKAAPASTTRPQPMRPATPTGSERRVPQVSREQKTREQRTGEQRPRDQKTGDAASSRREREQQKSTGAVRETANVSATSTPQGRSEASESVARHVKDAFSRELTHLQGTIKHDESKTGAAVPTAATQAEELVHLLRSPATIRQVILLREVLDRPVDRW